jgi:hypothetical protein
MNRPRLPDWSLPFFDDYTPTNEHIAHVTSLLNGKKSMVDRIPRAVQSNLSERRLLIVGGGLTSANLVEQALSLGFRNITLMTRTFMRAKYFDVTLPWVGRYRNVELAKFYGAEFKDRFKMIRDAREGGSVTPEMLLNLKAWKQSGVLRLLEQANITACTWNSAESTWSVDICVHGSAQPNETVDLIWLATGWYALAHRSDSGAAK